MVSREGGSGPFLLHGRAGGSCISGSGGTGCICTKCTHKLNQATLIIHTCRAIATAQPFASAPLSAKPVAWETRSDSAEYVWGLQRRVGLHVTAAAPAFAALREHSGIVYDPLGDGLVHDSKTDRSRRHSYSTAPRRLRGGLHDYDTRGVQIAGVGAAQ